MITEIGLKLTEDTAFQLQKIGKRIAANTPVKWSIFLRSASSTFAHLYPITLSRLRRTLIGKTGCVSQEVLHLIRYHDLELPRCRKCGVMTSYNKKRKTFFDFCSGQCAGSAAKVKDKRRKTNFQKFGGPAPMSSLEVQKKFRKTSKKRYGTSHPMKSGVVQGRCVQSSLAKYGTTNPSKAYSVRQKISDSLKGLSETERAASSAKRKATMIERCGAEHNMQSPEGKKRHAATCIARYGVRSPLHSKSIRRKGEQTRLSRYGVRFQLQHPESFAKQQRARYKHQTVIVDGVTHSVQGWEAKAIENLLARRVLSSIVTNRSSMPRIAYRKGTKQAYYFPDFRFKHTDGRKFLVEVKSDYTLKAALKINLLKFKAANLWCGQHGYEFILAVGKRSKGVTFNWIRNPKEREVRRALQ